MKRAASKSWHHVTYRRAAREETIAIMPTNRAPTLIVAILTATLVAVVGCSSDEPNPVASAASSSDPAALPTPSGTVPDSIEDINSTKDMTGVVTNYSNDANPYIKLIPYVCPFLPDSLTRDKLGMVEKQTGFGGQHTLLQICRMATDTGPHYEGLSITVTVQATSFANVTASPTHTDLDRNVPIWRNVNGTLYQNAGDVSDDSVYCNLAWGTFYGSAVVTVSVNNGYAANACNKVRQVAPLIAPYLPSAPVQMRPTEG